MELENSSAYAHLFVDVFRNFKFKYSRPLAAAEKRSRHRGLSTKFVRHALTKN